jgi:hypothetical protein
MDSSTVRTFDGGLNVIDTDLNMSPKFAKELDNVERAPDGSLSIRPGTKLFADLATIDASDIVNAWYYNDRIITVQSSGRVCSITGAGVAASHATLWASAVQANAAPFNGELVIVNGVHKPLLMANDFTVDYLQDLATTTNINTPIAKYVMAHGRYLVMAGDPADPDCLHISNTDTAGTWLGDAAPNTAIQMQLGSRVPIGSSAITGLQSYRDKLIVAFEQCIIPFALDNYIGSPSVHSPIGDGAITGFGCTSHRSMVSLGDDVLFCDNIGVNSVVRTVLNNTVRPERASELIDPRITTLLQRLTLDEIDNNVFAVYDQRNRRYILFVPRLDADGFIAESVGFSYTNIPSLKVSSWCVLRNWNWSAACRTQLGNVIFTRGTRLYTYDFDNTDWAADYIGEQETFSDDTPFSDGYGLSPGTQTEQPGVPIDWQWEWPWSDFKKRMDQKRTRYLALDTTGTAQFTAEMYVDNKVYDGDGERRPSLTMTFEGGSIGGYGNDPYGGPYGAGRVTSEERLYAWTSKFKIMKLRFYGSDRRPLKIVSVSVGFQRLSMRR